MRAGVEIRLKDGWHTYWRYPGDAGVPPKFDFGASQKSQSGRCCCGRRRSASWRRAAARSGFSSDVIFPVRVEPVDAKKPVLLRLKLDYAICEKLCVPAEATIELAWGLSRARPPAMLPLQGRRRAFRE